METGFSALLYMLDEQPPGGTHLWGWAERWGFEASQGESSPRHPLAWSSSDAQRTVCRGALAAHCPAAAAEAPGSGGRTTRCVSLARVDSQGWLVYMVPVGGA